MILQRINFYLSEAPVKLKDDITPIRSDLTVHLYIRSRTAKFFQGPTHSITSVNATGVFDILPMHANFITLVKDYVIIDRGLETERKIEFKTAVMSALDNKIDVYVDI